MSTQSSDINIEEIEETGSSIIRVLFDDDREEEEEEEEREREREELEEQEECEDLDEMIANLSSMIILDHNGYTLDEMSEEEKVDYLLEEMAKENAGMHVWVTELIHLIRDAKERGEARCSACDFVNDKFDIYNGSFYEFMLDCISVYHNEDLFSAWGEFKANGYDWTPTL